MGISYNSTDSTEALRANWRRELERRALKIRSIPVAKLLKDLADPEKMLKHERICVELARRFLQRGMAVTLKSGKLVRIYEIRDDGYFYIRKGGIPLPADGIDWQGMFCFDEDAKRRIAALRHQRQQERQRQWYEKNREKVAARTRQWRADHPDLVRECRARAKAKRQAAAVQRRVQRIAMAEMLDLHDPKAATKRRWLSRKKTAAASAGK